MGPGSGPASDPFSPSAGPCVAEKGLLGSVLSLCEEASGGAEPPSPWAGEGGYCRAPGFEREDQVRGTDRNMGIMRYHQISEVENPLLSDVTAATEAYPACFYVIFLILFAFSG